MSERTSEGTGVPMIGIEVQLGEEAILEGDGSGQALPPVVPFGNVPAGLYGEQETR